MVQRTIANSSLLGGHPALDFVNTVDSWRDRWGPDYLLSYSDALLWSRRVELLPADIVERLERHAAKDPAAANAALERLRALRQALHAVILAEAEAATPDDAAADRLATATAEAAPSRHLVFADGGFHWSWEDASLDAVHHRLAFAASELLVGRPTRRPVRECKGVNCGWLFLDTSRGGHRRWCSEAACGGKARVRRFRARAV